MFCCNCGKEVDEGWKVCPYCGMTLQGEKNENKYVQYQTVSKEKVKFSHMWLIPKLILIWIFAFSSMKMFLEEGIPAVLLAGDWTTLLVCLVTLLIFGTWVYLNLINYAGNEHLVTFGIEREVFMKGELIIKKINKVYEKVLGVIYSIFVIKNFFEIGFFSWYTWLAPFIKVEVGIMIGMILELLEILFITYRPVTKRDFFDDEE